MYIEMHNWLDLDKEVLYFKLNNSFSMNSKDKINEKIDGIFAVFSDDECIKFGSSKNIASALATLYSNKHKSITKTLIFNASSFVIKESEFHDFYTLTSLQKRKIIDDILLTSRIEKNRLVTDKSSYDYSFEINLYEDLIVVSDQNSKDILSTLHPDTGVLNATHS